MLPQKIQQIASPENSKPYLVTIEYHLHLHHSKAAKCLRNAKKWPSKITKFES